MPLSYGAYWLEAAFPGCPQCDINADGDIDVEDCSALSRNWLQELYIFSYCCSSNTKPKNLSVY